MNTLTALKEKLSRLMNYEKLKQELENLIFPEVNDEYNFIGKTANGLLFKKGNQYFTIKTIIHIENYDPAHDMEYQVYVEKRNADYRHSLRQKIARYEKSE